MNLSWIRYAVGVAALMAAFQWTSPEPAHACAPAPKFGEFVQVLDESALIVWDSRTRTQHFIRRAGFAGARSDFGFLVPTPGIPELAEASHEAFAMAEGLQTQRVVEQVQHGYVFRWLLRWLPWATPIPQSSAPIVLDDSAEEAGGAVSVVHKQRVAGYDAVVLEADGAGALARWLGRHGFAKSAALERWLQAYVAKRWKLTAFKITLAPAASMTRPGPVRMSFTTDQPFFPYAEPEDQRDQAPRRALRVYFLGDQRVQGVLANGNPWPGRTLWTRVVSGDGRDQLRRALGLPAALGGASMWLTEFLDESSPRPGTADLIFARSPTQAVVEVPPQVVRVDARVPVPIEPLLFAAALTVLLPAKVLIRRLRATNPPT